MTISFKISPKTRDKMITYFKDKKRSKTPPYAVFQADSEDTVVTLYESNKVVFQGISADIDANMWKEFEEHLNPNAKININKETKKKVKETIDPKIYYASTIGSDEVGTGDFFGPIVVSASYVPKEDIAWLESLGAKDSKKLTDDKIMELVPQIIKKIKYQSLILSNTEYNEKYSEDCNLNKIKAILHNKALLALSTKYPFDYIVVDQFAKPATYYAYLKEAAQVEKRITFRTKGEDKCLAVACASMISRYIFIKEMAKLSQNLKMELPKGSSEAVDEVAKAIIDKYGVEKLKEVAKLNFKNTKKIS